MTLEIRQQYPFYELISRHNLYFQQKQLTTFLFMVIKFVGKSYFILQEATLFTKHQYTLLLKTQKMVKCAATCEKGFGMIT